jgi:hypothetical protein
MAMVCDECYKQVITVARKPFPGARRGDAKSQFGVPTFLGDLPRAPPEDLRSL